MSGVSDAVAQAGRVVFEPDRFAMTSEDLCVVEGRWFGVRGRRFIRPSLTVTSEGNETRLLADLADKPWAAEDGEPWKATFSVTLEIADIEKAELTVAPDITIALHDFPDAPASPKPKPSGGRAQPSRARRSRAPSRPDAGEHRRRELAHALEAAKAEKANVAARLDALLGELTEVARERDEISAERDHLIAQRDRLAAERDEAANATDAARVACDRAVEDRDAATAALRRAESDRDLAIEACDRAISEREEALASRDLAAAERDAAAAERDQLAHQRDALARTREGLQSELAELSSARGAALVMRRAVQERSHARRSTLVGPAAIAILVLLTVVVALIVTRAL